MRSAGEGSKMADSAAVSVPDDGFSKGWNADESASSVVSAAVTAAESQVTQATSAAVTAAESRAETQASSASGSAAESSVASSAAASEIDYKQRWKSQEGIVRSMSVQLSSSKSETEALRTAQAKSAQDTQAASAATSVTDQLDTLEKRFMELHAEGNVEEALKVRKEIRKIERENDRQEREAFKASLGKEVQTAATATLTAAEEAREVHKVVAAAYVAHPYLDHESPVKNDKAIRYVQNTAGLYMDEGKPKHEAISMAVSEAGTIFGSAPASSVAQTAAVSQVDDETMKSMAAVASKDRPIKTGQKAEGKGSFDAGWAKDVT